MLPQEKSSFGSGVMKINNKAELPESSRGRIARTYMDETYSRYSMSSQQEQLMKAWDKNYPVNAIELKKAHYYRKMKIW